MLQRITLVVAALVAIAGIIQGLSALNKYTIKAQETICAQAKDNEIISAKNNQLDYLNKSAEKYQSQKSKIQNSPDNEKIHSIAVRDVLKWMRDNCSDGYSC